MLRSGARASRSHGALRSPLIGNPVDGSSVGWFKWTCNLIIFSVVVIIIATTAAAVSIGRYAADGPARSQVATVQAQADTARLTYRALADIATLTAQQLVVINNTNAVMDEIQANITETGVLIGEAGYNDTVALYNAINASIPAMQAAYEEDIAALARQLTITLSVSNVSSALQRSGTCTLGNTTIDYEYRVSDFAPVTLPFYVFSSGAANAALISSTGDTNITIGTCAPPLLEGPVVSSPLLYGQLSGGLLLDVDGARIADDALATFYSQVVAGAGLLEFRSSTNTPTGVTPSSDVVVAQVQFTYFPALM